MTKNMSDNIKNRIVKTGRVILKNMSIFEPRVYKNSGNSKYCATVIIPKSDRYTLRNIKQAIRIAIEDGKNLYDGKIPDISELAIPLKNGDDYSISDIIYANSIYLNATSNYQPRVVGEQNNKLSPYNVPIDSYGEATLLFNPYNIKTSGNKGVSCQLLEVKLLNDKVNPTDMLLDYNI